MGTIVGILDTETNKNRVEFDGDVETDRAIVKNLEDEAKTYTFKNLIGYMVRDAQGNERPLADEVKEYLEQHNGSSTLCQVRACDEQGDYLPSGKNSTIIDLEESVTPYVTRRNVDGEEFDCVEMIVGQITSVGR